MVILYRELLDCNQVAEIERVIESFNGNYTKDRWRFLACFNGTLGLDNNERFINQ